MNKMEFNTTLEESNQGVKVIIDEFVQYDPMSDSDTGYTNYRVFINDEEMEELNFE